MPQVSLAPVSTPWRLCSEATCTCNDKPAPKLRVETAQKLRWSFRPPQVGEFVARTRSEMDGQRCSANSYAASFVKVMSS